MKAFCFALLMVLSGLALAAPRLAHAAPTAEQRRQVESLRTPGTKANNLLKQDKYQEAAEVIAEIQQKVGELAADANPDMLKLLGPIHKWLQGVHTNPGFDLNGVDLPDLAPLPLPGKSPKPATPAPATAPKPNTTPAPGEVSFTKQVAPILVGKCGRCHVQGNRGNFSMATFDALMRGSEAGIVVRPGDDSASRLIEVIETGDMPRGGGKLSADELAALKMWVKQGAKFDGSSRNAPIAANVPPAAGEMPRLEVVQATGRESILFSRDIAPVIAEKCANCHGRGNQPSGRLTLTNFRGMLNGGDSGAVISPGKPAESLLIQKLKGTASDGDRMPKGQPPLSDEVIAKFEKWIQEGAKFDGPDPMQDVAQVAAIYRAIHSTHEELSAERAALAQKNWQLALPDVESAIAESANFHMRGNVGENTLKEVGERAEQITPKVAALLGPPTDKPLIKGRMTLFVVRNRYDYSELGRMVEKRDIPSSWKGHWGYNIVDAYGAVVAPSSRDTYTLDTLIGQQLAGAYVASLGKSPRWFAEGAARAVAARLDGGDERVLAWDEQLPEILGKMQAPDDFLTGKLSPEEADVASYSFVSYLMSDAKRFRAVLEACRQGASFDQAFAQAYGASPSAITPRWIPNATKKRGLRRSS